MTEYQRRVDALRIASRLSENHDEKAQQNSPSPTSSRHTPGPWFVTTWQHAIDVDCDTHTVACDVREFDAHLIAAAPDMLVALKAALMCMEAAAKLRNPNWDGFAHPDSPITLARAAIAKAEGRP